ncbi:MAG: hypothetical protein QXJ14_03575 [Candidatus Aenigmatarchaeota archaeon]
MGEFATKKLIILIFLTLITMVIIITTIQIASEISNILGMRFSDIQVTNILSYMYSSLFYRANFSYDYKIEKIGNIKYGINSYSNIICINSSFVIKTEDCLTIPSRKIKTKISETDKEIIFSIEKKWK